jgi:two-component system phosphate regulon sensor histidine kinase PhoR
MKHSHWRKFSVYLTFFAMMAAACGLIYLALAQLPRQRYILHSMLEEQARRLLADRAEAIERQIAQEEEKIISSLNPIDRNSFAIKPGWADIAFLLDSQFNIVLPATANYAKWQEENAEISADETAGRFFLEGQKYEFSLGEYDKAAKFYTLAVEQSLAPLLEIKVRLALASCLFKLKNYEQAADEALQAAQRSAEKTTQPYLELNAWYWYAMSLEALHDPRASEIFLNLYKRIIQRDFFLPRKSQYIYWEKRIYDLLHERKLAKKEEQELIELESQGRFFVEAEDLCHFLQSQGIENIKRRAGKSGGNLCHYYGEGMPYMIAYQALLRDKTLAVRGFRIRLDHCRRMLSPLLAPVENFVLVLRSPAETPVWGSIPAQNSPLASLPLKAWEGFHLTVWQKSSDELEKMIAREKIFTLLITGLIAVVLFAGFYFTWKTFMREMELSQLKSDFVACISHELRTPLALIQSCTETLALGRVGEEKRTRYYNTIMRETERLTRLITNILNVAQIEAGRFHIVREELSLGSLLEKFVEEKAACWPDYHGRMQLQLTGLPALVWLDGAAIRSAIFNLLDNAVKYGPADQSISLVCTCDQKEICLCVEDHGKGIAAEEQQKIFEKFYRGRSARGTRGIGLGLKLVFHIVKAHGGTILLRSVLGQGTRVDLKIPLCTTEEQNESENSRRGR